MELSVNLSDEAGSERLLLELLKHRFCHVSSGRGREACRKTLNAGMSAIISGCPFCLTEPNVSG